MKFQYMILDTSDFLSIRDLELKLMEIGGQQYELVCVFHKKYFVFKRKCT